MTSSVVKTDQGIAVTGNLVYANVSEILKQADQFIEQSLNSNQDEFIVDCKNIERIDSAGIALLLDWQRESSKTNKSFQFVEMPDQAKSLIQAYRLQSVITAKN